jgi:hypothetical protein|uniref:EF-hand domain-containing protein n=1 Tax=viral metagenome TaxID=1070528 RepID=A0A6C0H423_9ZZZZ
MYDLYKKFLKKNKFDIFMRNIETNKLLIGVFMIFMNIGSRYIELRLTKGQEMVLKNIAREVLIFTIAFVATKDLILSFIITCIFIILANFVFNEKCKFCILPDKYKNLASLIDTDKDNIISENEINKAYDTLKKARGQIDNYKKIKTLESFNNMNYD